MATSDISPVPRIGSPVAPDVVEIGLLLPASWADALVELSRRRGQSVGQLLRGFIDQALNDELGRS